MSRQSRDPDGAACAAVEVEAPARLHLGFLDLDSTLGRRFGSIGLAIDGIATRLRVVSGGPARREDGRLSELVARLSSCFGLAAPVAATLEEAIPQHVGLGSGTQLRLAAAAALAALAERPDGARDLATFVERGARSGIGIAAFETGGFLVDGGKSSEEAPAPIVARAEFPPGWRLVLVLDAERRGLSGAAERAAFAALPAFPAAAAARLCHVALLRLLPGLAEADFAAVADAVGEINARVGDHFAAVQGGRYASPRVAAVLDWLGRNGFRGTGQSSWGPTGFVLVPDEAEAAALCRRLEASFANTGALTFRVCGGRNRGAIIREIAAAPRRAAHRSLLLGSPS